MAIPMVKCGSRMLPMLGLGTYLSKPTEALSAVKHAIDLGYRHIDCAYLYGNEKDVGKALKEKLDDGTVTRDELFIVSKLWHTFHRKEDVGPACDKQLADLGLDYLDLYLVHFPLSLDPGPGELDPKTASGEPMFDPRDPSLLETWSAMEQLVTKNKVKNIGVSNYNIDQMNEILQGCSIKPSCLQAESHPLCPNTELIQLCKSEDIAFVSYRSLGKPDKDGGCLLKQHVCIEIAEKYHVTPAQVLLRYHLDRGVCTIPKSTNPARLQENFEITKFVLDQGDLERLNNISGGKIKRLCTVPNYSGHRYYPFKDGI